MSKYRKLIVAGVGFGVMIGTDVFGLTALAGIEQDIVNVVVTILTLIGIERATNTG